MAQTKQASNDDKPFVDPVTMGLQRQIIELKETIAELAAEGHEVRDATKHLNSMIESLRIKKFRN
jgi:hypothetical protein